MIRMMLDDTARAPEDPIKSLSQKRKEDQELIASIKKTKSFGTGAPKKSNH